MSNNNLPSPMGGNFPSPQGGGGGYQGGNANAYGNTGGSWANSWNFHYNPQTVNFNFFGGDNQSPPTNTPNTPQPPQSRFDPFIYQQAWFQTQSVAQGYFEATAQYHAQYQQQLASTGYISQGYASALQNMQNVGISTQLQQAQGSAGAIWGGTFGSSLLTAGLATGNLPLAVGGGILALGSGGAAAYANISAAQQRADAEIRLTQQQLMSNAYAMAPIWANVTGRSLGGVYGEIGGGAATAATTTQFYEMMTQGASGQYGIRGSTMERIIKGYGTDQFPLGDPALVNPATSILKTLSSMDAGNIGKPDSVNAHLREVASRTPVTSAELDRYRYKSKVSGGHYEFPDAAYDILPDDPKAFVGEDDNTLVYYDKAGKEHRRLLSPEQRKGFGKQATQLQWSGSPSDVHNLLMGLSPNDAASAYNTIKDLNALDPSSVADYNTRVSSMQYGATYTQQSLLSLMRGKVDYGAVSSSASNADALIGVQRSGLTSGDPTVRATAIKETMMAQQWLAAGMDAMQTPFRTADVWLQSREQIFGQRAEYSGARSDIAEMRGSRASLAANAVQSAQAQVQFLQDHPDTPMTSEQRQAIWQRLAQATQQFAIELEEGARDSQKYRANIVGLAQTVAGASVSYAQATNAGGSAATQPLAAMGASYGAQMSVAGAELMRLRSMGMTDEEMANNPYARGLVEQFNAGMVGSGQVMSGIAGAPTSTALRSQQSALGFQSQVLQSVPGSYGNVRQTYMGMMQNTQAQINELSARRDEQRRSNGGVLPEGVELDYQNRLQGLGLQHMEAYNQLSYGWQSRLVSESVNAPRSAALAAPFLSYRAAVGAGVRHPAMGGTGHGEYDTPLMMAMAMGHSWAGATGTPEGMRATAMTGTAPIYGSQGVLDQIRSILQSMQQGGGMSKDTSRPAKMLQTAPLSMNNR